MLSLFPYFLSFGLFAPTILRLALAATLGMAAWKHLESGDARTRFLGIAETITGALLVVGLWTQAAALVAGIIAVVWFAFPTKTYALSTVYLSFILAISLFFLGAGRIAFDLPL